MQVELEVINRSKSHQWRPFPVAPSTGNDGIMDISQAHV